MTAFDKARKTVAIYEKHKADGYRDDQLRHGFIDAVTVARALLAYEPTPDATEEAQKIFDEIIKYGKHGYGATLIASAIARATAATRAETIEECAKVAENNNSWPQEGEEIAAEIRALGGAR